MTEAPLDVLVLCGVGVDTIVRVPDLSIPPGDLLHVEPVRDYVAHSGNGVALGFHALGLRTKFIDFLGDDAQGAQVLARYAAVGLDFEHVPAPNGTPRSVNLVDAAGRRFSFYDGRHPADLRLPRASYLPALERARHVHVAGRASEAFADARRLGITTSTDIHSWDGEAPWAMSLAREADLVFLSAEAAPQKIEDLMHSILDAGRASMVVATEGDAGCRVLARADRRVVRFPTVTPERPVVDSNGAGDAFSTAFMSRWFAGRPLEECALAGAVSGAFACGAPGTHEEQITAPQLDAAIERARHTDHWRNGR
ncbi:carbohydrate kinase family protein [Dactylosporangium sp. NBC_01737]|uniref:carbohydrate kinase family protein n=1 Tax=Dactylosporangium sp. NBC_01737 TaxID=2975959 RepID=UPI002E0F701D|nr:carbohydrate kinase family protein [Dactylosporangium sp. NBC_01737]